MSDYLERSPHKTERATPIRGTVIVNVADYFREHLGEEVHVDTLMYVSGGARNTISNCVTRLMLLGWEFTKPTKSSYRCIKHATVRPISKSEYRSRRNTLKSMNDKEWLNRQANLSTVITRAHFDPPPVLVGSIQESVVCQNNVPNHAVEELHVKEQSVEQLERGDILEIVFISRAGTVHAEDAEGRSYRVEPLD